MSSLKFVQISAIPRQRRLAAQRRVVTEGITAVQLSNDTYRVKSSNRLAISPRRSFALLNQDYYNVQFFESNGEVFAACSCPFGREGDVDNNVCKHIEAALAQRTPTIPIPPKPVFQNGKAVIDVQRSEVVLNISKTNSVGQTETYAPLRRRITPGTGETVLRKIESLVNSLFTW